MIFDIFSSFDPSSFISLNKSTNILLVSRFFFITLIQIIYWIVPNRTSIRLNSILYLIFNQLTRTFSTYLKGRSSFLSSLFIIIILVNLIGLNPYTFRLRRHLIITLSLRLPLWLTFIISSFSKNIKSSIAHILPDGAPDWLNPFLILIETTRIVVRPLTLAFRLAANIRAGHIVLGLIRIYGAAALMTSFQSSIILVLTTLGYVIFEIAICLIQAYIFCLLLSLYSDDHAHYSFRNSKSFNR